MLQSLIDRGILVVDDLDERVLLELRSYSDDHLLAIIKEFSSLDRNSVRNVPSYLLGIIRKVPVPYNGKILFLFLLYFFIPIFIMLL